MSGPLDPEVIRRCCINYSPEAARFVLDACASQGKELDVDTVAILVELGKSNKPDWVPRDAKAIMMEILASRGVQIPEPREEPEPVIYEKEDEPMDIDEEERPL